MNTTKISAIILTRNEEKNIEGCINSLLWCNEIIIIDDYSEDETLKRIKNKKIIVFERKLNGNFSEQRNFGLSKATGDWILFIDADEIITEELKDEIHSICHPEFISGSISGYFIKRRDIFLGKEMKYGETGNIKLLRLARKNAGKWSGAVHETWNIAGTIETLHNPIIHYPHHSISSFLTRINYYTDILAQTWQMEGRKIHFWSIVLYPKGKFIQNYIFRLGFLDGVPGIIIAIMMSFHSFVARGKLWLLQNKKQNG